MLKKHLESGRFQGVLVCITTKTRFFIGGEFKRLDEPIRNNYGKITHIFLTEQKERGIIKKKRTYVRVFKEKIRKKGEKTNAEYEHK